MDALRKSQEIHGLRGLAALIVFVFHINDMATIWGFWPSRLDYLNYFFQFGRYGVEIFFIISGYLITASIMRHQNVPKFLLDRVIRIYPVFLTIHVLVFALGPLVKYKWMAGITASAWLVSFIENLVFLPGLFDLPAAQIAAWSLGYEAAFYLAASVVYLAAMHVGRSTAVAVLILLASSAVWAFPIAIYFPVGAAVYWLVNRMGIEAPAALRRMQWPAFITTLAILAIDNSLGYLCYLAAVPGFLFFWSIVGSSGSFAAFLRRPALQYLGTISYSFYLWAGFISYPLKVLIVKFVVGNFDNLWITIGFAVVALPTTLAVSHASQRVLEVKGGRLFRRLLQPSDPATLAIRSVP